MKIQSEAGRLARYQSVINILMTRDSFDKPEIYGTLKNGDATFIGRIINDLVREGYLTRTGLKTKPLYFWTARKKRFNAGQWINERIFTTTVKRSPFTDRPRERLLRLGPSKLKISELLAILIRSGLRGESALQAGEKLAAFFGRDLEKLSLQSRGELKQISRAMGKTAYCQIMAALELGKRLADQRGAKEDPKHKIRNSSDALTYCQKHFMRLAREARQEEFHVILLDERLRIIKTEKITVGLLNKNLVHPREILKPAIRESAWALILVHNHPCGDPTPSLDDKIITGELKKAAEAVGLLIIDHIILAKDKALSMAEEADFRSLLPPFQNENS